MYTNHRGKIGIDRGFLTKTIQKTPFRLIN